MPNSKHKVETCEVIQNFVETKQHIEHAIEETQVERCNKLFGPQEYLR